LKKLNYCKKCSLFVLLTLFMTWIRSFVFTFTMQSILGNNCFMFIINVFFHGGDAMRWIVGEKALALTSGIVWTLNLFSDMENSACVIVCGAPNKKVSRRFFRTKKAHTMVVKWFVNQNFLLTFNYCSCILQIVSSLVDRTSIWVFEVWNVESYICLVFNPSTSHNLLVVMNSLVGSISPCTQTWLVNIIFKNWNLKSHAQILKLANDLQLKHHHCRHHQSSEWAPQQRHQPPYDHNDAQTNWHFGRILNSSHEKWKKLWVVIVNNVSFLLFHLRYSY